MTGVPTIVVVDDAAEVRTLVRTRLRLSGQLDVVGEGASRPRRGRARRAAPAGPDAARRLDAGHGRSRGAARSPRRLAGHARRDVQRLRRGRAWRIAAGARARRRSSRSPPSLDDPRRRPPGAPGAGPAPTSDPTRRRCRPRSMSTPPHRRASPCCASTSSASGGLRGRRDRHGHDDALRTAWSGPTASLADCLGRRVASSSGRRTPTSRARTPTACGTPAPRGRGRADVRPVRARRGRSGPGAAGADHARRRSGTLPGARSTCSSRSQDVSGQREPRRSCGAASCGSGSWSRPCRTTRSSCSTPRAASRAGTPAPSGSRGGPPRRSSASTSAIFYPPGQAGAAAPRARARDRAARGPLRGGGLAGPQGRHALLGTRDDHRGRGTGRRARRASPRSPATTPTLRAGQRAARGRQRTAAGGRRRPVPLPGDHRARAALARGVLGGYGAAAACPLGASWARTSAASSLTA